MKWNVYLRCDVVKGQWNDHYHSIVYHEVYYLIATNGINHYIHYYDYKDDWCKCDRVYQEILLTPNFTPENKPSLWLEIIDIKPIVTRKKYIQLCKNISQ